jgi:hypothetical protein
LTVADRFDPLPENAEHRPRDVQADVRESEANNLGADEPCARSYFQQYFAGAKLGKISDFSSNLTANRIRKPRAAVKCVRLLIELNESPPIPPG